MAFDVVSWMADRGHTGYANQINEIMATKDELIGETGRYWQHCEFTTARLAKMDEMIAEIRRDAQDRYDDWASD